MFIEFSITNFRSILSRQTLSMVASADDAHLQRNVTPAIGKGLRLLRSAVIYGPNAAGKSNILRALYTLQQLVLMSATAYQAGQPLPVFPFLLTQTSSERPTTFEIVFTADDGVRYHYYCEVCPKRVYKEWLVAYPQGRAQRWFERSFEPEAGRESWWFGPHFKAKRAEKRIWQSFTGPNVLFLSNAIKLNNAQLLPAYTWLTQKLIVLTPETNFNPFLSLDLLRQGTGHDRVMRFMQAADIGIDRLQLEEQDLAELPTEPIPPGAIRFHLEIVPPPGSAPQAPKSIRVLTWHKRVDDDEEIPLDMLRDESDGTRKLFEFTGGWLRALDWGATLFVDELDRSLHPHLTRFLVDLFHSDSNVKNAQLVFTTHDTTLLDKELMRRDQIWFVEKDKNRSSHLYSLLEYSPRKDEALERGYLKGRYGAIPFIGNLTV